MPEPEDRPTRASGVNDLDMRRLHRHLVLNLDRIERLQQQVSSQSSASAYVPPAAVGGTLAAAASRLARRSVSHLATGRDKSPASTRSLGSSSPPSPHRKPT